MKKIILASLMAVLAFSGAAAATQNSATAGSSNAAASMKPATKRGPVFRANKDQIKQVQTMLKQRGFYNGEATGKLDDNTRAGLKQYQAAETVKVTGTLNRATLEKMNVSLTEKQKSM